MTIPDYQTIMLPLLKIVLARGPVKLKDVRLEIVEQFNLSD